MVQARQPSAPSGAQAPAQVVSTWSGQAREQAVQRMFTAIAGVYDLNNTLLSFGLHYRWKQIAASFVTPVELGTALDVGSGTADLALALCLDAQTVLRPDLRLLAMSGLLPASRFQLFWAILMFAGIPAWTLAIALLPLVARDAAATPGLSAGSCAAPPRSANSTATSGTA